MAEFLVEIEDMDLAFLKNDVSLWMGAALACTADGLGGGFWFSEREAYARNSSQCFCGNGANDCYVSDSAKIIERFLVE